MWVSERTPKGTLWKEDDEGEEGEDSVTIIKIINTNITKL